MTHIIFWNPDISSMTRDRMSEEMTETVDYGGCFDWSFWEHDNIHPGDICYLVRCSDEKGPHGLMLRARITSEAYIAEDWAGKGRTVYYANFEPQEFIDTEYGAPVLPETLEAAMPDFNWRGGHSGRELPKEYEPIIEKLWYDHIETLIPDLEESLEVNPRADELTPQTLDFWKKINASKSNS